MFVFMCPDCDEELVKYGERYLCEALLREAVDTGENGVLVAPVTSVHPEPRLWKAQELIAAGLFKQSYSPAWAPDDRVEIMA